MTQCKAKIQMKTLGVDILVAGYTGQRLGVASVTLKMKTPGIR
jgi:hypothetical protein